LLLEVGSIILAGIVRVFGSAPLSLRQKYIFIVVLVYLVLALSWIFLSDQLLLLLISPEQLLKVSMLKGMLFVLVSAVGLSLALKNVPLPAGAESSVLPLNYRQSQVRDYVLAAVLVGMMLWFRLVLPIDISSRPMLVLQLFPIILAAVLGGFGAGLFATLLSALAVGWVARAALFGFEQSLYVQLQWLFLLINGITVSWLCQQLRNRTRHIAQQQRLLDAVIEGTDDVVFTKDMIGRYQLVNQAACRAFGREASQILGRTDTELLDAAQALIWQQNDAKVRQQQQVLHFQEQIQAADGKTLLYSVSKGPLFDHRQQLCGSFGIARDVTAMVEQKRLLQRVLEGSEQGFWEWDLQQQRMQVSERFETMLGYQSGEMDVRPDNWRQMVHPADFAAVHQSIERHLQGLAPLHEVEFRARCKDGSWRWVLCRGKVVTRTADGSPLQLAGTHTDIQQRRHNEETLRLAELMFAGSYDGMMLVDAENRILRVNPAFCRITGYSPAEIEGKSPRILSSGLHEKGFYQQMWRQLLQHGFWRGEIINKRKDGSVYTEMLSISVVRDAAGQIRQYIGIFADISQLKAHAAELDKVANFDALTGLPNRRLLLSRFNQTLIRALQTGQRCAVCLIDIDGFKQINEEHGSAFGDRVLLALSHQLQSALRHDDTLARLGGDEFVVLLSDMPPLPEGNHIIKRLLQAVNRPLQLDSIEMTLTSSIGVSLYPDDNADPDTLLRHAGKAMFQAKEAGRNRIQWFDPEHEREAQEHRMMLEQLHEALQQHQFVLFYQPKVNLRSGEVVGVEALIRWQHPQRGLLSPAAFLPFIEGSELESQFGQFVLHAGIMQADSWLAEGIQLEVGINISASHLLNADFAAQLSGLLQHYPKLSPGQIELEILESTAIRDLAAARDALRRCQGFGVRFALDDFGTGYSSLTYLRQLPVHSLKIDQSFVRDMLEDPDDRNIVAGVVQLAQVFDRDVIAEGVESMAHASALLALGCELAQGYGIARPMPAAQIRDWIGQWQARREWLQLCGEQMP
jgi:diguanylate cyclase (GGDEF)-like protein/PAS domain S-box-containing protein